VRRPPPSFSRRPMWEKLFRILLGGCGNCVPRGWPLSPDPYVRMERRSTKDCAHLHFDKSDEPSPRIPFSHHGRLADRSVQQLTLVPRSQFPNGFRERKTKYGSKDSLPI
jgi:hypothetical protein